MRVNAEPRGFRFLSPLLCEKKREKTKENRDTSGLLVKKDAHTGLTFSSGVCWSLSSASANRLSGYLPSCCVVSVVVVGLINVPWCASAVCRLPRASRRVHGRAATRAYADAKSLSLLAGAAVAAITGRFSHMTCLQELPADLWDEVASTMDDKTKASLALASAVGWKRPWAPHALATHRFAWARHQLAMKLRPADPYMIITMPSYPAPANTPPPVCGFWPWWRKQLWPCYCKRGTTAYVDRVLRHCDSRIEVRRCDHGLSVLYVHCVNPPPRKPRSSSLATYMNDITLMGREEYRRRASEKWREEYRRRTAAAEKARKRVERRAEHERRKQNMHLSIGFSMVIEAETTMYSDEEEDTVSWSPEDHDIDRHLVQVAEMLAISSRMEEEYDYDELEVRVMKKAERRVSHKRRALW